ncbi:hypothetical protein [Abyssibacter sp.]|jgi:hypothetical protein|uniref:hypothetical protein n=1 Tax=Abyssibacter sp. TaxID=2320200 RepID=UPI0025B7FFDD|nr:hypothetical protein [Abyssibacter sp.]MCK5857772.1 hypothetical protein [Abyssibacter sp.]
MARLHTLLIGSVLAVACTASFAATTTGSRIDRESGEACGAHNVKVITRDDLERSGALTVAQAIQRAPRRADTALPECRDKPKSDATDAEAATG